MQKVAGSSPVTRFLDTPRMRVSVRPRYGPVAKW